MQMVHNISLGGSQNKNVGIWFLSPLKCFSVLYLCFRAGYPDFFIPSFINPFVPIFFP